MIETDLAVRQVHSTGCTPYQAAKDHNLPIANVYRACKRVASNIALATTPANSADNPNNQN